MFYGQNACSTFLTLWEVNVFRSTGEENQGQFYEWGGVRNKREGEEKGNREKEKGERKREERAQENPCLIFTSFSLAPTKMVTLARHTPNCRYGESNHLWLGLHSVERIPIIASFLFTFTCHVVLGTDMVPGSGVEWRNQPQLSRQRKENVEPWEVRRAYPHSHLPPLPLQGLDKSNLRHHHISVPWQWLV